MKRRQPSLAKTTRPTLSGVVPRERVFALLDTARDVPVTWVSGPPGCGKTTAVASYLERDDAVSLWYQLDEGDADVATFFYYLRAAAAERDAEGAEALPLLTAEYHGGLALFARRWFQTLYARLGTPFTVVFDGVHEVPASSELHEAMRVALRELPSGGRAIVVSRSDPPPTLARLRAHGALATIGWDELRLTRDETAALVAQRQPGGAAPAAPAAPAVTARPWDDAALDELHAKTAGWAAGLVLMLEQARATGSIAEPPDAATREVLFDYLAGELFETAAARTRNFLLRTAFLPQMSAGLVQDLTGDADAGQLLAELYRDNYFVTLRPARPEPIYQYHPMFREFLLARAQLMLTREQRRRLQASAASLLAGAGQVEDAVALYRDSRDWLRMARLIEQHAGAMLAQGRGETVLRWIDELPLELHEERPWTLYWAGASQAQTSPRKGRHLFELAYTRFAAATPPDMNNAMGAILAASGAMDAILYELDDFALLDRWISVLDAAERSGFATPALEARVACSMVFSLTLRQPQRRDIGAWIERAIACAQAADDVNLRMFVGLLSALSIMWAGAYPQARALIERAQADAKEPGVTPFSLITLHDVEAMFFMLTADRERCRAAEEAGLALAAATGVGTWSVQLLVHAYGGALGGGDLEAAAALRAKIEPLVPGTGRLNQCLVHHFAALEATLRDDMMGALQHAKRALTMAIEAGAPYFEVLCRLALAQVLSDCGDEAKCVAHLRRLRAIARHIDNKHLEFSCLLGFAQIALDAGRRRAGLAALRRGLELGRQYGYRHFLWWRPAAVARLCASALAEGIETDYVRSLVRTRALAPEEPPLAVADWPWTFRVQTLGSFHLSRGAEVLGETGKAQRRPLELLRVLIACGGQQVPKEHVADLLWPRVAGDSAQRSLTSTLHRLRKLLGDPAAVVLHDARLTLERRLFWVDAWALDAALDELDAALRRPAAPAGDDKVAALGERIIELYGGPFLGMEDDETWAIPLRDRLRTQFVRAVTEVGRRLEQAGAHERAIGCYERCLEADPLAEGLYRQLMQCHAGLGRTAEAIEVYGRCRRALAAAHGVEPSGETRQVYERLAAGAAPATK